MASRLPPELGERHTRLYSEAIRRARERGGAHPAGLDLQHHRPAMPPAHRAGQGVHDPAAPIAHQRRHEGQGEHRDGEQEAEEPEVIAAPEEGR